uniref:Uncharacterized protein n=1 Tax=Heterorhabditis bacteriophora TaxID=37862 RepID=A0A1I7WGU3_HETBA
MKYSIFQKVSLNYYAKLMELTRGSLRQPVYYVAAIGAGLLLTRVLRILYLLLNVYTVTIVVSLYIFYEVFWKRRRLPNGPIPWLITGNMPAFVFARSVDELFQSWRRKFGGIFTVWIGPIPLVMICDIQSMKKYFIQNADLFSNRWRNNVTDAFMVFMIFHLLAKYHLNELLLTKIQYT